MGTTLFGGRQKIPEPFSVHAFVVRAVGTRASRDKRELTLKAVADGCTGNDIRLKFQAGAQEDILIKFTAGGEDVDITYIATVSTANSLRTLMQSRADFSALVSVSGVGAVAWVAGDADADYVALSGGRVGRGLGVTFVREDLPQPTETRWSWYRMGGPGPFSMTVEGELSNDRRAIADEWEVVLEVRLKGDTQYSTWYRGIIRTVERQYIGQKVVSKITGSGYWATYMNRLPIESATDAVSDVKLHMSVIFGAAAINLLHPATEWGVEPNSRIVFLPANVDASTYAPGKIMLVGTPGRFILLLAELQGNREFFIDPSDRKFYFKTTSDTVKEGRMFVIGKDIDTLRESRSNERKYNSIVLLGHPRGGFTARFYQELFSATDRPCEGERALHVLLPGFSKLADAQRWATNKLTEMNAEAEWTIFKIGNVTTRIEDPPNPLGKVRVWRSSVGAGTRPATSRDYPIFKVEYRVGTSSPMEMETPSDTPDETRPKGLSFEATIYSGRPPLDLPEVIETWERQHEAVRHWIKDHEVPRSDPGLPGTVVPADHLWSGKLYSRTGGTDALYQYDATNAVWVQVGHRDVFMADRLFPSRPVAPGTDNPVITQNGLWVGPTNERLRYFDGSAAMVPDREVWHIGSSHAIIESWVYEGCC